MKSIINRRNIFSICIVVVFILTVVLFITNLNKKTIFKLDSALKNIEYIIIQDLHKDSPKTDGSTKDKTEIMEIVNFLNSIEFKEIVTPREVRKEYSLILAGNRGTVGDYIEFNDNSIKFQLKFFELSSNKKHELKKIIDNIVY